MADKIDRSFPLIETIIQDKQDGSIYQLDDGEFIINKAAFSFVKGKIATDTLVNFFASEKSLPQYFHVYDANESLINAILSDDRFGQRVRKRLQLRFEEKLQSHIRKNIPLIKYKEITEENYKDVEVFERNCPSIFWRSENDYLKNGVGVILYDEFNKPASICYSACVANQVAEIDIFTMPEHRGKGFAKAITEEFIEKALQKDIIPNWDCFEENIASLKTAKKLNFTFKFEYTFLSIFRN